MTGPEKGLCWGNKQSASSVGAGNEDLQGAIRERVKWKPVDPKPPLEETPFR